MMYFFLVFSQKFTENRAFLGLLRIFFFETLDFFLTVFSFLIASTKIAITFLSGVDVARQLLYAKKFKVCASLK